MPASKPYRFHPQAWQEVEAAEAWYRQRNYEASARFLSEIYDALENLAQWPQRWPSYQYGTRRFVLHRFPFSIIYRDESAAVSIVAITSAGRCIGRTAYDRRGVNKRWEQRH